MNQANVISVNPGQKTLGELHINEHRLARISKAISGPSPISSPLKKFFNTFFGINSKVNAQYSKKILLSRVLIGALYIYIGLQGVIAGDSWSSMSGYEIATAILGASIFTGLLTRVTGIAGVILYGIISYSAWIQGDIDISGIMMLLPAIIMIITGPGRYSIDQMIRYRLFTGLQGMKSRHRQNRRKENLRYGYRAYANVDRRVM